MSDNYIRLIPTAPMWQPDHDAAAAASAHVAGLFAGPDDSIDEVAHEFFPTVAFIDSGENTSHATCRECESRIELGWVLAVVDERQDDLTRLDVRLPCCGAAASLNDLNYDWAVGFARFEITALNGSRDSYELDAEELRTVAFLLGHPVRQVLAHY